LAASIWLTPSAAASRILSASTAMRACSAIQQTEVTRAAAPTKSGHIEPSSLKQQHAKVFDMLAKEAQKNNVKPLRPFVLYSLRHTFLTRLGESGCDVWTLARIAGHSSIAISSR